MRLLSWPGKLFEGAYNTATIAWNATGDLYAWSVHITRLGVEAFAKRRFPKCYDELDGGDIRIMRAFLEPESASNTYSLLGGPDGFRAPETEMKLLLNPVASARFADDAYGPVANRDNSFVIAEGGAKQGSERWLFINGIATTREMAKLNVSQLTKLFGHDFINVHNPTQGVVHDIVESALQKFTNINTEPSARAFIEIADALLDPSVKKVRVVAHSQGTIIVGDALDLIYCGIDKKFFDRTNMNDEELEQFLSLSHGTLPSYEMRKRFADLKDQTKLVCDKLELYMFANAASRMCYLNEESCLPHIESYVNESDIVTRLGALARDEFHREDLIRIDGPVLFRTGYGHLLNAHYLPALTNGAYTPLKPLANEDERCIESSIHEAVRGNPCARNPKRVTKNAAPRLAGLLVKPPRAAKKVAKRGPPDARPD